MLVLTSLLLAQLATPPAEDAPTPEAPPAPAPAAARKGPEISPASTPPRTMSESAGVQCGALPPTPQVPSGLYRVQCLPREKLCLVSSRFELDGAGVEGALPLSRASPCSYSFDPRAFPGYRYQFAAADTPDGWVRDERGRVMQFNFDLHRRVYFGGGWSPAFGAGGLLGTNAVAQLGIDIEWSTGGSAHRFHFLETDLRFGLTTLDVSLLRWEATAERKAPTLWLTTFIGRPRRVDIPLNLMGWLEVGHLELLTRGDQTTTFLTIASAHATVDLWHSADLTSYLRLRAGPGLLTELPTKELRLPITAGVEADVTLDRDGFHHLHASGLAEQLLLGPAREEDGQPLRRLRLRAGYEVILLAVNDYPLSLALDAGGTWRNDLLFAPPRWEWTGTAALRFSFWAPARRNAPRGGER